MSAENYAFAPTSLSLRAGSSLRLAFTNRDDGVPHSVAIRTAGGAQVFAGATVSGVRTVTYSVNALPAGTYTFFCTVHTFMTGTLIVR